MVGIGRCYYRKVSTIRWENAGNVIGKWHARQHQFRVRANFRQNDDFPSNGK